MQFTTRPFRARRPSREARAACRYHDDVFRFTAALKQAWLLSSELVDAERGGWKRPREDVFVRAFALYGYGPDFAARAWAEYDGASGDDPRQNAIAELDREIIAVGRAQAYCGGKINRRLHI